MYVFLQAPLFKFARNFFFSFWTAEIHFTVTIVENVLDIFVPINRDGQVLLANLVCHIDALLQEWYPNLCKYKKKNYIVSYKKNIM